MPPVMLSNKGGVVVLQDFQNQVAGHKNLEGHHCLMVDVEGHLWKYEEDSERGRREEAFYEKVFSEEAFSALRQYLPFYHGAVEVSLGSQACKYIKLENLLHGLNEPNIIDVKIGKVTYSPFATPEKRDRELRKHPFQKRNGFRIPAMKVFNLETEEYAVYGKLRKKVGLGGPHPQDSGSLASYLKQFFGIEYPNPDDVTNGNHHTVPKTYVAKILHATCTLHLLQHILADLQNLKSWMTENKIIKFYGSSILIAYDSQFVKNQVECLSLNSDRRKPSELRTDPQGSSVFRGEISCGACGSRPASSLKSVIADICDLEVFLQNNANVLDSPGFHIPYSLRMIDFCHAFFDVDRQSTDCNYIFGLDNLICFMKEIYAELKKSIHCIM